MGSRHILPRVWLVTDERQGDRLLRAVDRLPAAGGILFRHYSLAPEPRRRLFDAVKTRRPDAMILLAGPPAVAPLWGADGSHGWETGPGLHSVSVHNLREIRRAEASGPTLLFLSPVFPTRSHPGGTTLGPRRFAELAHLSRRPVIALGGLTPARGRTMMRLGAHGWAAVDAWLD